jgi:hypothetical protein
MPEFDFDVVSSKPEPERLAALRRPPSEMKPKPNEPAAPKDSRSYDFSNGSSAKA